MNIPECVQENIRLLTYTSFTIGGPARYFAEPKTTQQLFECVDFANSHSLVLLPLGCGCNIVVCDSGVPALVVHLSRRGIFGEIENDNVDFCRVRAGGAAGLQALVNHTLNSGLGGIASWIGIPGSVGGAVCMNAGPAGRGIGEFVDKIWGIDINTGCEVCIEKTDLRFGYRASNINKTLITSVEFVFPRCADSRVLMEEAKKCGEQKRNSQPLNAPSAGCIFTNPPNDSAGRLIDQAGCKGMMEGGAQVSEKHANFIINIGGASCCDVTLLAARVRQRVKDRFGIELKSEVLAWGGSEQRPQRRLLDGECSCLMVH